MDKVFSDKDFIEKCKNNIDESSIKTQNKKWCQSLGLERSNAVFFKLDKDPHILIHKCSENLLGKSIEFELNNLETLPLNESLLQSILDKASLNNESKIDIPLLELKCLVRILNPNYKAKIKKHAYITLCTYGYQNISADKTQKALNNMPNLSFATLGPIGKRVSVDSIGFSSPRTITSSDEEPLDADDLGGPIDFGDDGDFLSAPVEDAGSPKQISAAELGAPEEEDFLGAPPDEDNDADFLGAPDDEDLGLGAPAEDEDLGLGAPDEGDENDFLGAPDEGDFLGAPDDDDLGLGAPDNEEDFLGAPPDEDEMMGAFPGKKAKSQRKTWMKIQKKLNLLKGMKIMKTMKITIMMMKWEICLVTKMMKWEIRSQEPTEMTKWVIHLQETEMKVMTKPDF
eukprot:UN03081